MKVAAIQMVSAIAREANLARAHDLLAQAAAAGAELAVLPEYFCMMGARDTDKLGLRETAGAGTVQGFLADAAREFGLWIVGGTLPIESTDAEHVFNSSLAFSPDGRCVARYDKIHLFFFDNGTERYDERRVIAPGAKPGRNCWSMRCSPPMASTPKRCFSTPATAVCPKPSPIRPRNWAWT